MRFLHTLWKSTPVVVFLLGTLNIWGQQAFHNYGNLRMHNGAQVGLFFDLENDGAFNQNKGLLGFYNTNRPIAVSGTSSPLVYDLEVMVDKGLYLYTTMGVTNNANLITGNVVTDKSAPNISLSFGTNAFYTGESDFAMVNGYASLANKRSFTFPVGDGDWLRPLTIDSEELNPMAKCAYFSENPSGTTSLGTNWNIQIKESDSLQVSNREFWTLTGSKPNTVTLTWNPNSDLGNLTQNTSSLVVTGWSKLQKKWIVLGNTSVSGDLNSGSISSLVFIPDDYDALTLGSFGNGEEILEPVVLDNYYMSPNGDGINDTLIIEGLEQSPHNKLVIFDRTGIRVYTEENYSNGFDGTSNTGIVFNKKAKLPSGVYFYKIYLYDISEEYQGYLYLSIE